MDKNWIIIIVLGLGTFLLRGFFILLFKYVTLPKLLERALKFVPGAVLAALVFPAILLQDNQIAFSLYNEKLVAAAFAAVVAWKTANVLWTLLTGMAILWILNFF